MNNVVALPAAAYAGSHAAAAGGGHVPIALSVPHAAQASGVCRSILYLAFQEDEAKRGNLPFLPSIKLGKRRLILAETLRSWLAALERQAA